jgi:hypothetical protein
VAASTLTCRGVAPVSRIAANRCSRRAADSRVAVPMNISTGNSRPSAIVDRMRSIEAALRPPLTEQFWPLQLLGGMVWKLVTARAPGRPASWPGR